MNKQLFKKYLILAVLLEVLEVLVIQTRAYDLKYIDCLHPQNIRRYQADKICETNNKIEETPTELNDENDEANQIRNYNEQHLEN